MADAYADFAKVYSRVGRWNDAESVQRVAMAVYDSALGRAHPVYAGALAGLCEIHFHAGRLTEATAECRESMAIRERAQGARSFGMINVLMLLGDMQVKQRRLAAADSFYTIARSIIQEHVGELPRANFALYPRLAALRDLQHRSAEAAELRKQVGGRPIRPLDF